MATQVLRCERHGSATRLTCVDCGKPICPKCSVRTEVGLKCEEHARQAVEIKVPGARSRLVLPAIGLGLLLIIAAAVLLRPSQRAEPPKPLSPVGSWASLPAASVRGTTIAVPLPDGQVLVAGGGVSRAVVGTSEIFDPQAGTWSPAGELKVARRGHVAVVLSDGRVLASGGIDRDGPLASAEIFDPATGAWTLTGQMSRARLAHSLTLLPDGRVLALGGSTLEGETIRPADSSAELFDPASGAWTAAGDMLNTRFEHTATPLDDGRVLIVGGLGGQGAEMRPLETAEIYDPVARTFTRSGQLAEGRTNHAAVKLQDGSVLVAGGAGGADADVSIASVEIFDPARQSWRSAEPLAQARTGATATLLKDGRVLVAAGESNSRGTRRSLDTAELYDPTSSRWRPAGEKMTCPRSEQAAAALPDGSALVVAGDATFPGQQPIAQPCAERYLPAT